MPELIAIANQYGIPFALTIGSLAGIRSAWRTAWPYLRDTYLPQRLAHGKEQAQAFKDIALLVQLIAQRLDNIENRIGKVEDHVLQIRILEAGQAGQAPEQPKP